MGESIIKAFGRLTKLTDSRFINRGFDATCAWLKRRGVGFSSAVTGRPQGQLRMIGLGMALLCLLYFLLRTN
jgi:hypothetical protein